MRNTVLYSNISKILFYGYYQQAPLFLLVPSDAEYPIDYRLYACKLPGISGTLVVDDPNPFRE